MYEEPSDDGFIIKPKRVVLIKYAIRLEIWLNILHPTVRSGP